MNKILIIGLLLISTVILSACNDPVMTQATPEVENLAKYLTKNDAVFYGTEWCPYCKDQKQVFGSAMEYIIYVDCDANRDTCVNAGIQSYPTWIIDGEAYPGTQQLYKLSELSGCPLNENSTNSEI